MCQVSLDLPSLAQENGEEFLRRHPSPLIVDEVQYAPGLLRFLKIQIDRKRNVFGQYILTGSQKFSLMQGVSETLAGRTSLVECHSLSLNEVARHEKTPPNPENILRWMILGGYPEIHAQGLVPERFYGDYLATYLERDVRNILRVKNLSSFHAFLRLLALRSGQVLNVNSLSRELGISAGSLKNWLSVLEASNIIYLLRPFFRNYGKRLLKSPKIYFLDTGLLCFLVGIHKETSLKESPLLGAFFETLVLGQFIKNFASLSRPLDIYYFRDNHGLEVDLILPEGEALHLYECKWHLPPKEGLPRNIAKFQQLVGKKSIKSVTLIDASGHSAIRGEKTRLATPVEDLLPQDL